ncbi:hypothetical protein l11_11350 [Neisseria weaveri LMG 5135]|nr:hypothetical protein l11_11350 [Neisseria weaveri LMG 5135]
MADTAKKAMMVLLLNLFFSANAIKAVTARNRTVIGLSILGIPTK